MTFKDKLFSFNGRMDRRDWWVLSTAVGACQFAASELIVRYAVGPEYTSSFSDGNVAIFSLRSEAVFIASQMITLWPYLAIAVKRAHDRGASAKLTIAVVVISSFVGLANVYVDVLGSTVVAFLLAFYLFFLLWQIATLGFIRGTQGANDYGLAPGDNSDPAKVFD